MGAALERNFMGIILKAFLDPVAQPRLSRHH